MRSYTLAYPRFSRSHLGISEFLAGRALISTPAVPNLGDSQKWSTLCCKLKMLQRRLKIPVSNWRLACRFWRTYTAYTVLNRPTPLSTQRSRIPSPLSSSLQGQDPTPPPTPVSTSRSSTIHCSLSEVI